MSERDNALIFCLCVISCTILFAAATIIKLLNQKRRVRYVRVELDTPQTPPLEEQAPKQPHVSKLSTSVDSGSISDTNQDNLPVESTSQDGNQEVTQNATGTESVRSGSGIVASNRRSSSEDSLFESKPERKSSESSHPSNPITGELKDSLKNDENSPEKEISSKPKHTISSLIKYVHGVGDGSDSNSRSIEVPKRDSPSMEAETDDGTHRSTNTHESSTYYRYSNGSIDEALDQDDGISVTERPPHGTSTAPPIVSNHSPEPLKRKDSGKYETTPDPKSGSSRTGSVSSSQSHTSKDESKSSESSDSESSVHMDQISSKRDKDSSQDVNTSHPSQGKTTQHTESDTSRTGSHSPANGNRRNELLSPQEIDNSIISLPAGSLTHNGPLDQQRGQTDREGPGNGASNENSASGLTGTVKKYIDNISKSTIGYLKDSIFGSKENSKGSPSEDQVTSDPQNPSLDEDD